MVVPIDIVGGLAFMIVGSIIMYMGIETFPSTETEKRIRNMLATAFTTGGFVFLLIKFEVTSVFGVGNIIPFVVGSYVTIVLYQFTQMVMADNSRDSASV